MLTKKDIQDSGFFNVEELSNNIFYIKDFLSKEENEHFIKIVKEIPNDSWSILNDHHHESFHNKFYDHNNGYINKSIREKINKIPFNLSNIAITGFNRVLRQLPGNHMEAHVDEINDQANGSSREYAAVVYLNDDYQGGELSYINFNLHIKPEAGSLMIFKTGPEYLHEVKTVLGTSPRYCLPGFIFSSWVDIVST
jgi:Rps23 Pro-64 3,4-dihydroxylase Tpa1-like proline 4-hydroxylase